MRGHLGDSSGFIVSQEMKKKKKIGDCLEF
jgi:hypothetical protein